MITTNDDSSKPDEPSYRTNFVVVNKNSEFVFTKAKKIVKETLRNFKPDFKYLALVIPIVAIFLVVIQAQKTQKLNSEAQSVPVQLTPMTVKVLSLAYYPVDSTGTMIDTSITGDLAGRLNVSLDTLRSEVNALTRDGAQKLTDGTKYHLYSNSNAIASLNYQIFESKDFLQSLPVSKNAIPWNKGVYRPDYDKILTDLNICNYVDNNNVTQVWLWGYHYGNIEPVESDMSMGLKSKAYWNYASYGDVSNSERINDLPICQNTYVLYNYNYGRGLGEMLEDHGHQIESLYSFVDSNLFNQFQNPHGSTSLVNHCGTVHSPPNVTDSEQYDWSNERLVASDCEDWKPGGGGLVKDTSCHTWYGATCVSNGGVEFKVWWMENIPGFNNGLFYLGEKMRDWWEFYGNFDSALVQGKKLTISASTPVPSPIVIPSPSPSSIPVTPPVNNDTTPPVVTILSPLDGTSVGNKGSYRIEVTASDASGISMVQISVDGNVVKTCSSYKCAYGLSLKNLSTGAHSVRALAVDNSVNKNSAYASVSFSRVN